MRCEPLMYSLTLVGAGVLKGSPSNGTTCAVEPHGGTLPRDLVLCLCYLEGGDARLAKDAGDGWVLLDSVHDTGPGFGIFLAACLSSRAGAAGWAGLITPARSGYCAQTYTVRLPAQYRFITIHQRGSIAPVLSATAAASTVAPGCNSSAPLALELLGAGEGNGANTTVHTLPAGYAPLFDTGQNSPPYSMALGYRALNGPWALDALTIGLSSSLTRRAALRGTVPISSGGSASHDLQPGRA